MSNATSTAACARPSTKPQMSDVQFDAVVEVMEELTHSGAQGGKEMLQEAAVSVVPMKGYPKNIFKNGKDAEKFQCNYCKNVLRNPLQSECGHRFCEGCRDEMRSLVQPVRCGACLAEDVDPEESILNLDAMFADKAAIREMRKLEAKCPNPNCSWSGQFLQYQEHENSCEKRLVLCSLCGMQVSQGQLAKHQKDQCPKRQVECPFCKQKMTYDEREKHNDNCPNAPIKCDKCFAMVPRSEMSKHLESECSHREIECPDPDCKAKMPRHQFQTHFTKHESLPKHMLFLYEKIAQLTSQVDQLTMDPALAAGVVGGASATSSASSSQQAHVHASSDRSRGDVAGAEGGQALTSASRQLAEPLQQKLKLHEDLMSVLHGEILRCIQQIEALSREVEDSKKHVVDGNTRIQGLTVRVAEVEHKIQEVNLKLSAPPATTGSIINCKDGSFFWRIEGFSQLRRAAVNEEQVVQSSPSFYTHPHAYKMRLRIFPNGDGAAKGNAVSVFMQLQKGETDELLPWPFQAKVYLMVVDQKEFKNHIADTFNTRPNLAAFKRPTGDNPASGCQSLISLDRLAISLPTYVISDTIFIKILIEFDAQLTQRMGDFDPKKALSSSPNRR
ncbi:TNF receptor-associated factor 2 [Aplysia californica]|uniref:TNF receptor-associated factor 2 n=1 Tax=Aplysia californica TaxID=6500 RepID=A0ABM0ZUU8_APLCA|nr:TNF receptor-associated factor 2 [Aplysia californica]